MTNFDAFGYPLRQPKLLIGGRISQLDNVLPHFVVKTSGLLHVLVTHPSQIADQSMNDSLLRVAEKEVSSWTVPISFFWFTFTSLRVARRILLLTRYLTYVVFSLSSGRQLSLWTLSIFLRNKLKESVTALIDPLFALQENSIESHCARVFKDVVLIPHFIFPGEGSIKEYKLELSGVRAVAAAEQNVSTKFVAVYPFMVRTDRQSLPENLSFLPPDNPRHSQKWLETVTSEACASEPNPGPATVAFFSRPVEGVPGELRYERLTTQAKEEILRDVYEFSKAINRVLVIRRHPADNSKVPLPEDKKNSLWVESNRHPLDIMQQSDIVISTVSSLGADASWLGVPAASFLKFSNPELFREWPENSHGVCLFTANSLVGMETACSSRDHLTSVMKDRNRIVEHQRSSYEKFFFGYIF